MQTNTFPVFLSQKSEIIELKNIIKFTSKNGI
jgi:hypothetical protein